MKKINSNIDFIKHNIIKSSVNDNKRAISNNLLKKKYQSNSNSPRDIKLKNNQIKNK
jgi:hypothetical protein